MQQKGTRMQIKNVLEWLRSMRFAGYSIGDLAPIVIAFALIAIIGAVSLLILNGFAVNPQIGNQCGYFATGNSIQAANQLCTNGNTIFSSAYYGVNYGVSGINQIMGFLPLIALVVVAAVIIGVVVGAFVLGGHGREGF